MQASDTTTVTALPPCPSWCTSQSRMDKNLIHEGAVAEGRWEEGNTFNVLLNQLEVIDDARRVVERDPVLLVLHVGKDFVEVATT